MAASVSASKTRHYFDQWAREGVVIALLTLASYLALALSSYHLGDPGWSSTGSHSEIRNAAGPAGAWIADILMYFLGYVSWLLPLLMVIKGLALLKERHALLNLHWPMLVLRSGGYIVLILASCALLGMYSVLGLGPRSGGVIGQEIATAALSLFSLSGSTLLIVALILTSISLATGLSWLKLMDLTGRHTLQCIQLARVSVRRACQLAVSRWLAWRARAQIKQTTRSSASLPPPDSTAGTRPSWRSLLWPFARSSTPSAERLEPELAWTQHPAQHRKEAPGGKDTPRSVATSPARGSVPEPVSATSGSGAASPNRPEADASAAGLAAPTGITAAPEAIQHSPARGQPLKIEPFKKKQERNLGAGENACFVASGLPSVELLDPPDPERKAGFTRDELEHLSALLEQRLAEFNVQANVVEVNPGPVITRFEINPAPGVKVSKINGLAKDLARSLAVISVRVVDVIPGKSVIGIEIPNENREIVRLRQVLTSSVFERSRSPLTLALGYDIGGNPVTANLDKMPHLLVAGTTGSGKSVGVNAMILSMLYKAGPDDLRLIMIDPKMLELSVYEGIPHLLTPVVTDMKEADNALRWCVGEMERRYRLMASLGVRNLAGYNSKVLGAAEAGTPIPDPLWNALDGVDDPQPMLDKLPFIVVIVDEFADMMMIVGKKVEEKIARIAQKARAAGIHLILATQRPSVDVITGLIKANIPTRIGFQVSSKIDSRTILDQGGAEQLLGHGDMLYLPPGTGLPVRVHGAFVGDDEVHRVVDDWRSRGKPDYLQEILDGGEADFIPGLDPASAQDQSGEQDALFDEAVAFVTESRKASISSVQRKLRIGYNRAATLVEAMEAAGVVSAAGHNGSREVLAPPPP